MFLSLLSSFFVLSTCTHEIKIIEYHDKYNKILSFITEKKLYELTSSTQTRIIVHDETPATTGIIKYQMDQFQIPSVVFRENLKFNSNDPSLMASITFIYVLDESKLESIIRNLRSSKFIREITPILVIRISQVEKPNIFNVADEMQRLWDFGMTRVIFIYFTKELNAVSYNPFTKTLIDVLVLEGESLFPNYLKNMNHFQLRVSLFEEWPILRKKRGIIPSRRKWVGRDYELLDIIVRIMNATFKVLEPPAETRYIGALKDIREKRVDFCFVRRFRMEDIDGIHLLSTGDLSTLNVIVPQPLQINQNEVLFLIFEYDLWICLIIFTFLSIISSKTFVMISDQNPKWTWQENVFMVWGILMNIPIKNFMNYNQVLRISSIFWVWACLIFYVSFQCRLIDLMTYPQYEKGIKTLKDLEKSDLLLYSSYNFTDLLGNSSLLKSNLRLMNFTSMKDFFQRNNSKQAFALPFVVIRGMVNPDLYSVTQSANYVILPEPLAYSFAVYMFPDDSPYRGEFFFNMMLVKQHGFTHILVGKVKTVSRKFQNLKQIGLKLSTHHLQPAFWVLCIGYFLSALSVICELIINYSSITHK